MKRPDKWDRKAPKVTHLNAPTLNRNVARALRRTDAAAEKRSRRLAQSEYFKTPQWRIRHEAYQEGWNAGFARGKYLQEAADQAMAAEERGRKRHAR